MGSIWELDFYSRPILDEKQKKIWEVLVCESPLETNSHVNSLFRYTQYCPNNQVNSVWLRTALAEALVQAPQPPKKIRFFRRQMSKMITKACEELGIPAQASRRTFTLHRWIEERMQRVYPHEVGFQPLPPNPSVQLQSEPPQPLPDALIGQQWAFVTLEAAAFAEMPEWEIDFGEAFPIAEATPQTQIPGVVLFSPRAIPMAGWMSGIEPAFLKVNNDPSPRLLLETGDNDSWVLANLKDSQTLIEAQRFEAAKQAASGVHFLAIQSDPKVEAFAGFWLLQELGIGL